MKPKLRFSGDLWWRELNILFPKG